MTDDRWVETHDGDIVQVQNIAAVVWEDQTIFAWLTGGQVIALEYGGKDALRRWRTRIQGVNDDR